MPRLTTQLQLTKEQVTHHVTTGWEEDAHWCLPAKRAGRGAINHFTWGFWIPQKTL